MKRFALLAENGFSGKILQKKAAHLIAEETGSWSDSLKALVERF